MNWKKELEDMKLPDEKELKKFKEQQSPKHSPEFEDWFSRVIGKGFNFTRVDCAVFVHQAIFASDTTVQSISI